MSLNHWQNMITAWQRGTLERYGHLTPDELRELGRKGKLSRPVVEFLIRSTCPYCGGPVRRG